MADPNHMRRALELGTHAQGSVSPRPPVGSVVVGPDGKVAGEGHTMPSPGPHAEVVALRAAGDKARGGTLYVTLEPCCHIGVTPACTQAIIDAGVARVVAAVQDPDPRVDGQGLSRLREAGLEVLTGILSDQASRLIEAFTMWSRTGRPLVTLKAATTLDGKVAAPDGTSRWITGPEARAQVHTMRARCDAVLVGAGTVAADDPELTCRLDAFDGTQPTRVVVDSSGRTLPSARIFNGSSPTLVATVGEQSAAWAATSAEVLALPRSEDGVDLHALLDELGSRGICDLLVEAGPTLAASLLATRSVDRIVVYLAPKLIGGDAPGLLGTGVKTISEAWGLRIENVAQVGDDLRIDARPLEAG